MQEVKKENLVHGKEYYLQNFDSTHLLPNKPYKMIAKFEKLKISLYINFRFACFSNFRKIEDRNNISCIRYVELNDNWKFYEISQNVVQKNMENRAYNIILIKIINDEYFKPINVL